MNNTEKGTVIVLALGTALGLIGVSKLVSGHHAPPPTTQIPTTISISAAKQTEAVDDSDVFTTVLLDQNSNPIPNYTVKLMEETPTSGGTFKTEGTYNTNSNGVAPFTVTFHKKGAFVFYAEA